MAKDADESVGRPFYLVELRPTAELPDTYEGLLALGKGLTDAGYTRVDINGEEWIVEEWGPSPERLDDHPLLGEIASGIVGNPDSMLENYVAVRSVGNHYWDWRDGYMEYLGRFDDDESALEASYHFDVVGGEPVVVSGGSLSPVEVELVSRGVNVGDPDERHDWTDDWDEAALLAALRSDLISDACFQDCDRELRVPRPLAIDEVRAIEEREEQLCSWAEPLVDTLRFVVADAEMRSIGLADALDARIAAYLNYFESAQQYVRSVLRIDLGGTDRPATEVARSEGRTLAILTAANPMGVELPQVENERRNDVMAAMLDDPLPATRRSPEGDWVEHGFAVTFSDEALDVAQRFSQAAVFIADSDFVGLVQLVGCDCWDLQQEYSAWTADRSQR